MLEGRCRSRCREGTGHVSSVSQARSLSTRALKVVVKVPSSTTIGTTLPPPRVPSSTTIGTTLPPPRVGFARGVQGRLRFGGLRGLATTRFSSCLADPGLVVSFRFSADRG